MREASRVHRASLAALEHDLTDPDAGADGERTARDVRHLEHLAVGDSGGHEARRHVDHESQARVAAPSLEPAGDVARQADALPGDPVDGFPRPKEIRTVEHPEARDRPEVCLVGHGNDVGSAFEHADLVAQVQVDRRRADLVRNERFDDDAAGRDLAEDHITGEDHGGRSGAEAGGWYTRRGSESCTTSTSRPPRAPAWRPSP